jgi:hypothetical protein
MAIKRFIKGGKGKTVAYKTLRFTVYDAGWEIHLGIGGPELEKHAQARIKLLPDQARQAAEDLVELAEVAEANRNEADTDWEESEVKSKRRVKKQESSELQALRKKGKR